jgi:aspartokinase
MWEIVKSGGIFMVPIIISSIILVGIVFERLWTLQRKRVLPQELIKRVSQLAEANQVNAKVIDALEKNKAGIGFDSLRYDDQIGKISLVGAGMKTNPGVTADFFTALSDAGVNIELISTSEIRISVVTRADDVNEAVRAVHTAFGLDSDSDEAVVYGGTGR